MLSVRTKVNTAIASLRTTYPNLNISSVSANEPTTFPTLGVKTLGETQLANDLEMTTQNAIRSTVELKVWTNDKMANAYRIINDAGDILIAHHYELTFGVEQLSDKSPYCVVARFTRVICSNDTF